MESKHTNSEGERISIEPRPFKGKQVHCLIVWDDRPPRGTGQPAPMLLDEGTRDWLVENLQKMVFKVDEPELDLADMVYIHPHVASDGARE